MKKYPLDFFTDPVRFIKCHQEVAHIDDAILINFLQDELHILLYEFLNGGDFNRPARIFFPVFKRLKNNTGRAYFFAGLLKNKYPLDNVLTLLKKTKENKDILPYKKAEMISQLYSDFYPFLNKLKLKTNERSVNIGNAYEYWREKVTDIGYLKPVIEARDFIYNEMKSHLLGAYLHGSLSTLDYKKNWSDFDALIIIREETITNPKKLLQLRNLSLKITPKFFAIDPFQHHGFFIIAEQAMAYYPQHFFPFELFKFSTDLLGANGALTFKERDSFVERINILINFCNYIKKLKTGKKIPRNIFEYKCLFHSLLLLPALYLESQGKYFYKKFSFAEAKKQFTQKEWDIIETVSRIRNAWEPVKFIPDSFFGLVSIYNPFLTHLVYKYGKINLPAGPRKICSRDNLIEGAYRMASAVMSKLELEYPNE